MEGRREMQMTIGLLADYANVSQEGKLNIMGVFDRIYAPTFPAVHPEMRLVMRFEFSAAELGRERLLEVRLTDADGRTLSGWSRPLPVPKPDGQTKAIMNQVLTIQGLAFERPGDYAFSVLIDADEKGSIPFTLESTPQSS